MECDDLEVKYKVLVESQRSFHEQGCCRSVEYRIQQLRKLKQLIVDNEKLLQQAIYADFGKSEFECFLTEFAAFYLEIDFAIKHLRHWAKPQKRKTNLVNLPGRSFVLPEPLGVSLVIGAWNYPVNLCLIPVVGAIAAGNTVVLKPSELSSHTADALLSLINANFPEHFLTVVNGGVAETTALLKIKFDKIFFTGSPRVGQLVYEAAAKLLTPVTLELGGKSPAIVTASANLEIAAKRLVWAKFLNAGQTCVAPDYVLVEKSVETELLNLIKGQIHRFDYSLANGNYVRIINQNHFERVVSLIDQTKVFCGGRYDAEQRIIEPTVLSSVSLTDSVMQSEIFGPVLPVISFSKLSEVCDTVRLHPNPLACYIFSKSKLEIKYLLDAVSAGGVCINDAVMHISNVYLPFGGVGQSGIGNYHGEAGFKTFSHYKSVFKKPAFEFPLKYSPYTSSKFSLLKKIIFRRFFR